MVSQKEKKQLIEQLTTLISNSHLYTPQSITPHSTRVQENARPNGSIRTIDTIVANFLGTTNELKSAIRQNRRQGIYTAIVFYQDEKTAHIRTVQNEAARPDKSFKLYTLPQIRTILTLRDKEKEILQDYSQNHLTYLRPLNPSRPITATVEKMNDVNLDYSHIKPGDQPFNFVRNKTATDYKLPEIIQTIETQAMFRFIKTTEGTIDPWYRAFLRKVE